MPPSRLSAERSSDEISPLSNFSDEHTRPSVNLVQGRPPRLATETEHLLRLRLQAVASIFCGGSSLYLLWTAISQAMGTSNVGPLALLPMAFAAMYGVILVYLSRSYHLTLRRLRLIELVLFYTPAVFLLLLRSWLIGRPQLNETNLWADQSWWLLLVIFYGMFVPNHWRRAARIVGAMALSPFILTLLAWSAGRVSSEVLWSFRTVSALAIMLTATAGSVYGAKMIDSLRTEVFAIRRFGQYRLKKLLGSGGTGEVYLAEHELMARPCAIKIILPSKANNPRVMARFEREVRATAGLSHWNTVEIFDFGRTSEGTFYYVMEYLPGLALFEMVDRHGPLPANRVVFLLRQVCGALHEAHGEGLVHRDIKPGNIFVAIRGRVYDVVKLLDFGLARRPGSENPASLTDDGEITGSPLYMAPELAMDAENADARADIYAVGAVAFFMLTGRPPFPGNRPIKVLIAHAHDEVPKPSSLVPSVPADLEAILLRCLAKAPGDRFQSVSDLSDALDACECARGWSALEAAAWWQEHEAGVPSRSS